jgi:hypothetical protein
MLPETFPLITIAHVHSVQSLSLLHDQIRHGLEFTSHDVRTRVAAAVLTAYTVLCHRQSYVNHTQGLSHGGCLLLAVTYSISYTNSPLQQHYQGLKTYMRPHLQSSVNTSAVQAAGTIGTQKTWPQCHQMPERQPFPNTQTGISSAQPCSPIHNLSYLLIRSPRSELKPQKFHVFHALAGTCIPPLFQEQGS